MSKGSVVLDIVDMERTYGEGEHSLTVLKEANLQLGTGEMVALVAPSGTGKSTLLHSAGLLETPDNGEIFVNGTATRMMKDSDRTLLRRSSVGFVYQFHHLLPEFSAAENLMVPQMVAGIDKPQARERARELLSYMRLEHRAEHRPSELSGGEQQRVAIARAVANAPSLLLADEPTGNLDPETSDHVFAMLYKLVRETGLAALIATHNHELARKMDRAVTLEGGKIADLNL